MSISCVSLARGEGDVAAVSLVQAVSSSLAVASWACCTVSRVGTGSAQANCS